MTKDKNPWKFSDWFKAQHGTRPSKKAVATLRNEVIELEKVGVKEARIPAYSGVGR